MVMGKAEGAKEARMKGTGQSVIRKTNRGL